MSAQTVGPRSIRRAELAGFLRTRRERVTPEEVGLPRTGRRRTPGLRREEVAMLAGVGVTWYTWLEQGREINVSAQVLDAVARSLLLDARERAHLFTLAATVDTEATSMESCPGFGASFEQVLAQLDPFPAAVLSWRYDVLGYNTAYRFLVSDLVAVPDGERNVLWLHFTHPAWRRTCEDWEAAGKHLVAKFRSHLASRLDDPLAQEVLRRLLDASTRFAALWAEHDVAVAPREVKRFRTPVGLLSLTSHKLFHEGGDAWLSTYSPADDATAAALPALVASQQAAAG